MVSAARRDCGSCCGRVSAIMASASCSPPVFLAAVSMPGFIAPFQTDAFPCPVRSPFGLREFQSEVLSFWPSMPQLGFGPPPGCGHPFNAGGGGRL